MVAIVIALTVGSLGSVRINTAASRFDLSTEYNKQQYDQLVNAHAKLESGFNFEAATQQAVALFALQDYKQAEKAWKYFIANRPRAIQGYWGLGEIYTVWERYEAAERNWLMAIEVDTPASYPNAYIKLSDLYRDVFPEKRYLLVQILTTAMEKNPKEVNYPLLLATYYRDTGDKESAIRFFEKVLEMEPDAGSAENIRKEINELKKG